MKNTKKTIVLLAILIFALFSCAKDEETITVSATAKRCIDSEGNVHIETTSDANAELSQGSKDMFAIQERYPQLSLPKDPELLQIEKVMSDSFAILSGGITFRLAGIIAPDITSDINNFMAKEYNISIERIDHFSNPENTLLHAYMKNGETVSFIEHSRSSDGAIIGYLYNVDYSLMNDPELKGFITGPSISCINESLLSSGYAVVDSKFDHRFSKKYLILQQMAEKAKVGLWKNKISNKKVEQRAAK